MKNKVLSQFEDYLKETLAVSIRIEEWKGKKSLPFFLIDNYEIYHTIILGHQFLIIVPKNDQVFTPAETNHRIKLIREKSGQEAILVQPSIASFNRQRLINYKIPFVVPGNQMYLPDLGIELKEHFRKIRSAPEFLSPSAQLLLLFILNKRIRETKTPREYAGLLGYSNMTLTRAFDELEGAGLIEVVKAGKERLLYQNKPWREFWDMSTPYLRSPVKNEVYIRKITENLKRRCFISELSALSEYTMISPPKLKVYAIGTDEYKYLCRNKDIEIVKFSEDAAAKLQEWKYSPKSIADETAKTIDKLSLYLNLRYDEDERIQSALEKLIDREL